MLLINCIDFPSSCYNDCNTAHKEITQDCHLNGILYLLYICTDVYLYIDMYVCIEPFRHNVILHNNEQMLTYKRTTHAVSDILSSLWRTDLTTTPPPPQKNPLY